MLVYFAGSKFLGHAPAAAIVVVLLTARAKPARAQLVAAEPPFVSTVEGFANLTTAASSTSRGSNPPHALNGRADVALRVFARVETEDGFSFGPRVVAQTLGQAAVQLGDRSLVLGTPWGRLEYGYRQGLPDTLVGYAPNSYAFVGVGFGPPSGLNLFPNGQLQTVYLASPVAAAIDRLSYLGIATAFAGDFSPKLIYVSPRVLGFQLGLSGTTNVDPTPSGADYAKSLQVGLVNEYYFGQNELRAGGSYGVGERRLVFDGRRRHDDLHSANLGLTLIIQDDWSIGASASYDYAGRASAEGAGTRTAAGGAVSLNYEPGEWAFGGYLQVARSADGQATPEELQAAELGASYRFDTRLRLFTAAYGFHLDHTAVGSRSVLGGEGILGIRAQL